MKEERVKAAIATILGSYALQFPVPPKKRLSSPLRVPKRFTLLQATPCLDGCSIRLYYNPLPRETSFTVYVSCGKQYLSRTDYAARSNADAQVDKLVAIHNGYALGGESYYAKHRG